MQQDLSQFGQFILSEKKMEINSNEQTDEQKKKTKKNRQKMEGEKNDAPGRLHRLSIRQT